MLFIFSSSQLQPCVSVLLNVTYNPNKQNSNAFLDQMTINIDNAINKKKVILLGDYNINHLDKSERSKLETAIIPCDLNVKNKTIPTRFNQVNNTESLIDYIIADFSLVNDTFICDSIVKSDHFATLSMLGLRVEIKQMPVQKTIYDKKNYDVSDFKHCLEQQNWPKIYITFYSNFLSSTATKRST